MSSPASSSHPLVRLCLCPGEPHHAPGLLQVLVCAQPLLTHRLGLLKQDRHVRHAGQGHGAGVPPVLEPRE